MFFCCWTCSYTAIIPFLLPVGTGDFFSSPSAYPSKVLFQWLKAGPILWKVSQWVSEHSHPGVSEQNQDSPVSLLTLSWSTVFEYTCLQSTGKECTDVQREVDTETGAQSHLFNEVWWEWYQKIHGSLVSMWESTLVYGSLFVQWSTL